MLKKYSPLKESKEIIRGIIEEFKQNISKGRIIDNDIADEVIELLISDEPLTIKECSKILCIKQTEEESFESFINRIIERLDIIIANNVQNTLNKELSLIVRTRIELLMPDTKKLASLDKNGIAKLSRILSYKADIVNAGLEKRRFAKTMDPTQRKQLDDFTRRYISSKPTVDLVNCKKDELKKIEYTCKKDLESAIYSLLSDDYKKVICMLLQIADFNIFKSLVEKYAENTDDTWNDICQNIKKAFERFCLEVENFNKDSLKIINTNRLKCKIIRDVLSVNSMHAEKIVAHMEVSSSSVIKMLEKELNKKCIKLKRQRFKDMEMPEDANEIIKLFIDSKQSMEEFVLSHEELNLTVSDLQVLILHYEALNGGLKNHKQTKGFCFAKYLYCDDVDEIEFILCQNETKIFEIMEYFSNSSLSGLKTEYGCIYSNSNQKICTPQGKIISFSTILDYFKKYYPISYDEMVKRKEEVKNIQKQKKTLEKIQSLTQEEIKLLDYFSNFLGDIEAFQKHFNLNDSQLEMLIEYAYYYKPDLFKILYSDMKTFEEDIFSEYMALAMEISDMVGHESIINEDIYIITLKEYHKKTTIQIESLLKFIWYLKRNKKDFYNQNRYFLEPAYKFCSHWTNNFMEIKISAKTFDKDEYLEVSHNVGSVIITDIVTDQVLEILEKYQIPLLNIFVQEAIINYALDLASGLSFEEGNLKQYINSLSFENIKVKVKA